MRASGRRPMTHPYLRRAATVTRIHPDYHGPEYVPGMQGPVYQPPYALDDLGDRETRDAFPAMIYKPAPPRDLDARQEPVVVTFAKLAVMVGIAAVVYPVALVVTRFQMWRGK